MEQMPKENFLPLYTFCAEYSRKYRDMVFSAFVTTLRPFIQTILQFMDGSVEIIQ